MLSIEASNGDEVMLSVDISDAAGVMLSLAKVSVGASDEGGVVVSVGAELLRRSCGLYAYIEVKSPYAPPEGAVELFAVEVFSVD